MRLAIDPGDKHVGWASQSSSGTIIAGEWDASEALDRLERLMHWQKPTEVIIEEYVLYAHKASPQSWSPMRTSEMIGAIKLLCAQHCIPWVEQGAGIKKPTRAQLRARGITQVGRGPHALDAELHLQYRLLREEASCS